jgi:hypothetical protein
MSKKVSELGAFVSTFRKLKEWTDECPERIIEFAERDGSIGSLCFDMMNCYLDLALSIDKSGIVIRDGVDVTFIRNMREFEKLYKFSVEKASFNYLKTWGKIFGLDRDDGFKDLWKQANFIINGMDNISSKCNEDQWLFFHKSGKELQQRIITQLTAANNWLKGNEIKTPYKSDGSPLGVTAIDDLLWLIDDFHLDIGTAFRRKSLLPDIYIPAHVSDRFHNQEKAALYDYLEQASKAFIFGSAAGSIALLRSVVELVLSEHYRSSGRELSELIDNAQGLPKNASASQLHRLRKMANAILHVPIPRGPGTDEIEERRSELDTLALINLVRELIEGAPLRNGCVTSARASHC